mgnify:CR=1 FL=1
MGFAAGGLVNPLEVIEQVTYLMFIHDLDDADNKRAKESAMLGLPFQSIFAEEVKIGDRVIEGTQLKWAVFRDYPADRMYSIVQEWVFPFIKTLHTDKNSAYSKYMDDAIFKLPTPLLLSKVVDSLDGIYQIMNELQSADVRGDVYEAFSDYLTNQNLDSRQIYFVNQIIEYIVHNGIMKDLSVLQEPPFTDQGSISEIFTDLSVWQEIRGIIEHINQNAIA